MASILSSISCNLDENILSAALPLFAAEKVQAIEWSFDTLYKRREIPGWFVELLHAFGNENRLTGHGVYFSLFSGGWTKDQEDWLRHLEKVASTFHFDHISEHVGFMTGENFHSGAPIPVPFNPVTLAIGQDRLQRIYNACKCPVGIENLAIAYSLDEVKKQGAFLNELVQPVNGFIILDLHNIYCQIQNFTIEPGELLKFYPLDRVREIHISGGSWEDSQVIPGKKIRRDTHDEAVPAEVFQLLKDCIAQCPHVKYVVLEQLSSGLVTESERIQFRADFTKMDSVVQQANTILSDGEKTNDFRPASELSPGPVAEDIILREQQSTLSHILETAINVDHAQQMLRSSTLSHTDWEVENWEPCMLDTAIAIAQKWKNGFA